MIPKLIHQTARTAELPEQCRHYVQRLRELHPDWTYRLWTDEDNRRFVEERMPEFLDVYLKLPKNIMRADAIRYVLMYRLGGLYMDTGYEMLRPFDMLDQDIVLPWESDGTTVEGEPRIGNAFFASAPGHPFWKMVLDDLMANPPLRPDANVLTSTGPAYLTGIYHRARHAGMELFTPERDVFNPRTPRNARQYRAILRSGVSYGIHHCLGSWREYTFAQRLRMAVSRLVHLLD